MSRTLYYPILQYHWLILSVFGGTILLVSFVLTYLAIWRPRSGRDDEPNPPGSEGISDQWYSFIPWILILTYVSIFVFAVVYSVVYMLYLLNV